MKNLMKENEVMTEVKEKYFVGDLDEFKYMDILRPEHLADLAGRIILWAASVDFRKAGYFSFGIDGGVAQFDGQQFETFEGADINKAKVMDDVYCLFDYERYVYYKVIG
jgi:hypothetical protein